MTAERQRLFVAVDPALHAVADLSALVADLHVAKAKARLAAPERWHITVAFLGDVAVEQIDGVTSVLAAVASGSAAVPLRIVGGGSFNRGPGTVLWAGLGGDVDALAALARRVRRELRRVRVRSDRKPYRPHLTIARPGDRIARDLVKADVATLAAYQGPEWTASELRLMRSHLGPTPHHEPLASFPLTTPACPHRTA